MLYQKILPRLVVLCSILFLASCSVLNSSTPPPPSPRPTRVPTVPTFRNSPGDVVRKSLYAIEKQDADQYLDALDPALRQEPNYFFANTLSKGLLGSFGLGGVGDLSKVSFRELKLNTQNIDDNSARVDVTGKLRNLAVATEEDFNGSFYTRNIDGTWYVSSEEIVRAAELQAAAQAAQQALFDQCNHPLEAIKFELSEPVKFGAEASTFKIKITNTDNKVHSLRIGWYLNLGTKEISSSNDDQISVDLPKNKSVTVPVKFRTPSDAKADSQQLTFRIYEVDDATYDYEDGTIRYNRILQQPYQCEVANQRILLRTPKPNLRLNGLKMVSPNEGWAFTARDPFMVHYKDGQWTLVSLPITDYYFYGMSVLSPNEVWTVGSSDVRPTIVYRLQNGQWEALPSERLREYDLRELSMVSPTEGWAVGDRYTYGAFLHYVDGDWLRVGEGDYSADMQTIQMLSDTDGWAGGDNLFHYNGEEWTVAYKPDYPGVVDLQMLSSDIGWAITCQTALHYRNGTWTEKKLPNNSCLTGISMLSDDEGWASTGDPYGSGEIFHYKDGEWTLETTTRNPLRGIQMISPTEGFAVGGDIILKYENGTWSEIDW